MMAVIALLLFVAMVLVIFVLRSAIQMRTTGDNGIRAGGLAARPGSTEWLAGWLLVAAFACAIGGPVADLLGLAPLIEATSFRAGGIAVGALGTTLVFLAQLDMGRSWRIGVDQSERTDLVTDGSFALVRNPIFSAMFVATVGLTMIVPNVVSLAGLVLFVLAVELQVRAVEEPHLRRLHEGEYVAYEHRVGRFAPYVGRAFKRGDIQH